MWRRGRDAWGGTGRGALSSAPETITTWKRGSCAGQNTELVRTHKLDASIILIWDNLDTHVSAVMRKFLDAHQHPSHPLQSHAVG